MVRGFGGSIDRDQSFFSRCIDIPLFLILVIDMGRGEKDERSNYILNMCNQPTLFFFRKDKDERLNWSH